MDQYTIISRIEKLVKKNLRIFAWVSFYISVWPIFSKFLQFLENIPPDFSWGIFCCMLQTVWNISIARRKIPEVLLARRWKNFQHITVCEVLSKRQWIEKVRRAAAQLETKGSATPSCTPLYVNLSEI